MKEITKDGWIDVFKNFLENEGLWERYEQNAKMDGTELFIDTNPEEFLSSAFEWNKDEYIEWAYLDRRWQKMVKTINLSIGFDVSDYIEAMGKIFELGNEIRKLLTIYFPEANAICIDEEHIRFLDNYHTYPVDEEE